VFAPRDRSACRAALGIRAARLALFVGNLVPVKAVDVLLAAWGMLRDPDAALRIVGDGAERGRLEAMAARLPGVSFLGALGQPEVARWMAAADVLVLPSRSEGMPNVVVEALASGVPVVASGVGGIGELVADGANGKLVPPGDPAALAGALSSALGRDWDREEIRASVAHLTWTALAERNLSFLARVAPPGAT
jgi:glycosyltransferase involved in cell wall biosynthesis